MGLGDRDVYAYDQRHDINKDLVPKVIVLPQNLKYSELQVKIIKEFDISEDENFVISTTNRDEINDDEDIEFLEKGDSIYILNSMDQELFSQTKQKVHFLPHYDTLVKSGMYEYYNSEGQNPLPYAFAELIDNSLAATVSNTENRNIEVRLILDDANPEKSVILVIDNGRGMTSWQLNNWAIYRLSKFIRQDKNFKSRKNTSSSPSNDKKPVPRSLNSEISYFGVGGKQAIFFIGNGTRMITKPKDSLDVHELCISKEQFEQKEQDKEFVYSGEIRNRKVADSSHLNDDEEILKNIISEEEGKESFTCVVISGIAVEHIDYLKDNFDMLCIQLAHIYHYYIHGPLGNDGCVKKDIPIQIKNIEIIISINNKGDYSVKNLRDIEQDMQSKYIQSAHCTFDFKAKVEGSKIVEGILRYHPFLYDQESYPSDPLDKKDVDNEEIPIQQEMNQARGRRPIFECFWNGRLIPYTSIRDFEWCAPKKGRFIPSECFNRISGVLWTNDDFQVSTNKLTFLDLENRMKESTTTFHRVINGSEKRGLIEKQFNEWIIMCHEKCDKQILFRDFQGHISRTDQPKLRHFPWGVFNSIEWDGKRFVQGQRVRTLRTIPIAIGTIKRFFLYGEYEKSDVYATGGEFEIELEPLSMFGDTKSFPLSKLDRKAEDDVISKALEREEEKLPHRLLVNWPEGDQIHDNDRKPAGTTIGAIKVEIFNRHGDEISKIPGTSIRLMIYLSLIWHSPKGDVSIAYHESPHNKTWPYWFLKMENIRELGKYTLKLQCYVNVRETEIKGKRLPSHVLKFHVSEGPPEKFSFGLLEGPFCIGVPFTIPLVFHDKYGNISKPKETFRPLLQAPGLSLTFSTVDIIKNSLVIKGVTALGSVELISGKDFKLNVKICGMEDESHTIKIRLLPGPSAALKVTPECEVVEIENNSPLILNVEAIDGSANITCDRKLVVSCKIQSKKYPNLHMYKVDLSSYGKGVLTSPPIVLKNFTGSEILSAKIQALNRPEIEPIEKKVLVKPSRKATSFRLMYIDEDGVKTDLEHECTLNWIAGETIKGIEFLIYDEGGRPVKITSTLAMKINVNWISRPMKDLFMSGKLPDITTPASTAQTMYCHVSLTDSNAIEFGFTIQPIAGEEFALKANCESGSQLRLGDTLNSRILVDIVDKHSNRISTITSKSLSNLIITAETLNNHILEKSLGKKSSFVIKNVMFTDDKLGQKEVQFKWNDLKDTVNLDVIAGAPSTITYLNYNLEEYVTLSENCPLPDPVVVQLCDSLNHPVEMSGIKVILGCNPQIQIATNVNCCKTNIEGQADFGQISVSLVKTQLFSECPAKICTTPCKGLHSLCAKAYYNKSQLTAPCLKLHIVCDPLKPVSMNVNYEFEQSNLVVGGELPDFEVSMLSENGNTIKNIKSSQLKMKVNPIKLKNGVSTLTRPLSYIPSESKERNSIFIFKNKPVPVVVGTYEILFTYATNNVTINSEPISVSVVSGPPSKLVAEKDPGLPAVSNTSQYASRCLVKSLKLHFEDSKDNVTGSNLNGTLHVQIIPKDNSKGEVPKMVGNVTSIEVPIVGGQVALQNVTIEENSPGVDGREYILRCKSKFKDVEVPPYDVRFIFCNDSNKQAQIAKLSKERDGLLSAIKTYQTLFDTSKQLLKELEDATRIAYAEENKIKNELKQINFNPSSLNTVEKVNQAILRLNQNRSKKVVTPLKRTFGMSLAPDEPGVIGKVGQLAYVEDSDVATVLSWHMQSDMDCVITHTMNKARELHKRTNGKMQLLPLDSIYQKNLPTWSRPLIHTKIRNYNPPGNPIYARNCLILHKETENCKLIFSMLLGDTILLDTLEEATHYREAVVKHMFCPTLLTRTGERIKSNGKFGGLQNRAPSIEKLRGLIFGEPPQNPFEELDQQIELLENLKPAVEKRVQVHSELSEQEKQENSVEMLEKGKEFQTAQTKMKEIEKTLLDISNDSTKKGTKRASNGVPASMKKEGNSSKSPDTLNGLGGLGLTRSQMTKLNSPSSESKKPPTPKRKRRS